MTPAALLDLLYADHLTQDGSDLRAFLKRWGPGAPAGPSAFARLAHVAVHAGDRLCASVAGHQAAIRRLFPDTPDDAVTAFCISEDQGPRPSGILSSLTPAADGFRLNGSKKWGSLSPLADLLYVAASIGEAEGRKQLRMVKVASGSAGLTLDASPYAAYRDHMPIADLKLVDVAISADAVLAQDAYIDFIKPFRLIEDVYGAVAVQIGVLRVGRAHAWPQDVLEDLTALILQGQAISETPMSCPVDVVLMSAFFRAWDGVWSGLGPSWDLVPPEERARWSPGTGTLGVAARARETRRQNAWAELTSTPNQH